MKKQNLTMEEKAILLDFSESILSTKNSRHLWRFKRRSNDKVYHYLIDENDNFWLSFSYVKESNFLQNKIKEICQNLKQDLQLKYFDISEDKQEPFVEIGKDIFEAISEADFFLSIAIDNKRMGTPRKSISIDKNVFWLREDV